MRKIIDKILHYLKKYNRPVVKLLQEGLVRSQIEKITSSTGLEFPEDFFKLYSCYNGTKVKENDILDDTLVQNRHLVFCIYSIFYSSTQNS